MRLKIDDKSEAQGFEESRLPHFSDEDSAMILGSSDFLGINFYTANYAYPETSDLGEVSWSADMDVGSYQDETWYAAGSSWLKVTPWGIRQALNWASAQYGQPDIYVTENGFSDKLGNIDDLQRLQLKISRCISYIIDLMQGLLLQALHQPGAEDHQAGRGVSEGLLRLVTAGQLRVGQRLHREVRPPPRGHGERGQGADTQGVIILVQETCPGKWIR